MLLFLSFRQNVSRETFCLLFSVAHSQIYFHLSIIWCWCQKVFWPLWCQIATCFALSQSSKRFVIRSFFFKKWLLTHIFDRSRGQKSSRKQACIGFLTFWPWYHNIFHTFSHFTLCRMFHVKHSLIYKKCRNKCFTWNI